MNKRTKWLISGEQHPVTHKASKFHWDTIMGQIRGQVDPNRIRLSAGWLASSFLVEGATEIKRFVYLRESNDGKWFEEDTTSESKVFIFVPHAAIR